MLRLSRRQQFRDHCRVLLNFRRRIARTEHDVRESSFQAHNCRRILVRVLGPNTLQRLVKVVSSQDYPTMGNRVELITRVQGPSS